MLTPTGMSEADPLANNDTIEGKAQNRRVSVNVLVSKGLDGLCDPRGGHCPTRFLGRALAGQIEMVRQTQHRSYQTRAAAAAAAAAVEQLAGAKYDRLIDYCVRPGSGFRSRAEIGRASCRERVCQYV